MNLRIIGKQIFKRFWQSLVLLFCTLLILELAYRYQWVDFFKTEFTALNKDIDPKKESILVFGDSFSAYPRGYVSHLRKKNTHLNVINCSLPGSGPYEMELQALDRIDDYKPKGIIYQMYVGNDLTDLDPPINWSELSLSRNCYWSAKNYFQVFGLFSRRLSGLQSDFDPKKLKQDGEDFKVGSYSPRTKMMIRASSNHINRTVMVSESKRDAMDEAIACIKYLREIAPKNVPIYIVVIPHFSQVTKEYNQMYAQLSGHKTDMRADYPFIIELSSVKGVTILNPIRYFRSMEAKGEQLYFSNDPHLNETGQQVLFDFIQTETAKLWQ